MVRVILCAIFLFNYLQCKTQLSDGVENPPQEINSHVSEGNVVPLPTYQDVEDRFKKEFINENPDTLVWLNQQNRNDQYLFWEEQFRNELIDLYRDSSYINTAFQEFAIRDMIKENILEIVFDQHGPDCGAPDCYSNIYTIALDHSWDKFPDQFSCTMSLEGCVDQEIISQGEFVHVTTEEFTSYYYSKELKQILELDINEEGIYKYARIHPEFNFMPNNVINQIDKRKSEIAKDETLDFYPYTSFQLGPKSYSEFYFDIESDVFE